MVSCDGIPRQGGRSVYVHDSTSLSIEACHPLDSAPELVADVFGRKALALVPEAQQHVDIVIPLDERVVHQIVLRAVRRDALRRAEVQHPVQHGRVDAEPDIRLGLEPAPQADTCLTAQDRYKAALAYFRIDIRGDKRK